MPHQRIPSSTQLYQKTLTISSYKTLSNIVDIDLSAPVGTQYALTPTSTVTIIDPYRNYLDALKLCFDFDRLREFGKREGFSMVFDGMHGAGGIFAKRVLVEELGLPEVRRYMIYHDGQRARMCALSRTILTILPRTAHDVFASYSHL